MKKIITIGLLILSVNLFSQTFKIKNLEDQKYNIKQRIKVLNDSVETIQIEINKLNSKKVLNNIKNKTIPGIAIKNGKLKNKSNVTGDIILELKEETPIQILDLIDTYYHVCIGNQCGYMSEMWIKTNDELRNFNKLIKEREDYKKQEKINKEKEIQKGELERKKIENRETEKKMLQKYGKSTFDKMKKRYFWIGMNKEMLLFSLGEPNDINKTVGSWGTHEQWIYNNGLYIYIENGKVTSYQK